MLKDFFVNNGKNQIGEICNLLNLKKNRMTNGDYSESFYEYEQCKPFFRIIMDEAKQQGDEYLANSQYIARQYFLLFCKMSDYFSMLQCKNYRKSWDSLQDCLDISIMIGKYSPVEERFEVPEIVQLFCSYESLYPYTVFASGEFLVSKSHCSICGKSMLGLECPHLKGKLYWGEVAIEVIEDIKKVQAVCTVKNPDNKRCALLPWNDSRTEQEIFAKLDGFLELQLPYMQNFSATTRIEFQMRDDIIIVGRNQLCSCGSGLKFKKCCGKNLYYQYKQNIIKPLSIVKLVEV